MSHPLATLPPSLDNGDDTAHLYCYGVDEAGRGCLAGPVVAAIVLFPPQTAWENLAGLNDSKKLSATKRMALVPHILREASAYGIGLSWQKEVDEVNIINATFRAMCRAFIHMERRFSPLPHAPVYIDGNLPVRLTAWEACTRVPPHHWHTPYFPEGFPLSPPKTIESPLPPLCEEDVHSPCLQQPLDGEQNNKNPIFPFQNQQPLIGGDGLIASISAASILAKTTRDALMVRLDRFFPHYGFAQHKGYGTKHHREALLRHGPCPLHRHSFIQKILLPEQQLSLFQ